MKPVIFGLSGPALTSEEAAFLREARPAGYILFKRNIIDRAQLRALTDNLRELEGRADVPILIDQEGGRVARMGPPEWPAFPAPGSLDAVYQAGPVTAIEAAKANAHALALMLAESGINVDCLPLLDVAADETHDAIGDRAFGRDPMQVAAVGRATLEGLRTGNVVGVVKHMPGQGRATVDSHHHLPRVTASRAELARDFEPFARLNRASMGMTSHVVYEAVDPERPATLSPTVLAEIIRGEIGFDGLLMSDDLDMNALTGSVAARAAGCVAAGCDLALNCWGRMNEMREIADALPFATDRAIERLAAAMATVATGPEGNFAEQVARRDALVAHALESGGEKA